jgi:hypothetical protein
VTERVSIAVAFEGMPGLALGGYSAGLLARSIGPSAEVMLRRPIEVDTELQIVRSEDGVLLRDDQWIYAEGQPAELAIDVPEPVSMVEAETAAQRYPGLAGHLSPRCFCCGPERQSGDGLRIFPGPIGEADILAAPWTPNRELAEADGDVRLEVLWAALDCPAIWALILNRPRDSTEKAVTGRLALNLLGRVQIGQPHVVMSWPIGGEGRKLFAGAAIFSSDGDILCAAKQTMVLTDLGVPLGLEYWRRTRPGRVGAS